jgi:integrase
MAEKRTGQNLVEVRPGHWKVAVNIPASASPDGKRHRRVAYVDGGWRDAERKRRELLTQRDEGRLKPRTAGTVSEYLKRWLDGRRPNVAARTAARWQGLIDNQIAPHIGRKLLRDVRPATLRELYTKLQTAGLSGTTRQKVHALLRQAFAQAVIDGDLAVNPCLAVRAPSIDTPEAKALDEDDARKLLKALADTPIHAPALVALDCGLRRGELLALHWSDVDLEQRSLVVRGAVEENGPEVAIRSPKTGHSRVIRLTGRATAALEDHKKLQTQVRLSLANRWADEGLVFPAIDDHRGKLAGRIWRPSSFSRVFREKTRAAGFEIGLHTLRHTHATTMLRAGVDPRVVADRLGHSTTKLTTDTYQHVLADHQQEAVEAYESRMEQAQK